MSASCIDFSQAKCQEWSRKAAYPRASKISALVSDPAFCSAVSWLPTKNFYCLVTTAATNVGNQQVTQFAESLRLLGWSPLADANEAAAATDRLEQPAGGGAGGLLIASPEVWTALKQQGDTARFASCVAYWEQRLPCFETYWQLHEALEAYEQGLRMFADIGLLAESDEGQRSAIGFEDILLPTVNLSEVWGRKLARFLKAHESFRLRRATAAPGSSLTCCEELEFRPGSEDKSGRKRLAQLDTMGHQGRSDLTWSGLLLQATATNPMLVTGRQFRLETYLLLAPRRDSAFGFAAFLHPGLVRIDATESPGESQLPDHSVAHLQRELQGSDSHSSCSPIKLKVTQRVTFSWLPEQFSDYLHAVTADDPEAAAGRDDCWLNSRIYPQIYSACAYISAALGTQHLLDSPYTRFQIIRLSFVVDDDSRRVRLDDFSQRTGEQQQTTLDDFCETLVLSRVFQESALIVAELLVRSSKVCDIPARSLVSPHNMKLVFDSMEPGVQRDLLLSREAGAGGRDEAAG